MCSCTIYTVDSVQQAGQQSLAAILHLRRHFTTAFHLLSMFTMFDLLSMFSMFDLLRMFTMFYLLRMFTMFGNTLHVVLYSGVKISSLLQGVLTKPTLNVGCGRGVTTLSAVGRV